jgi:hypothetical protein
MLWCNPAWLSCLNMHYSTSKPCTAGLSSGTRLAVRPICIVWMDGLALRRLCPYDSLLAVLCGACFVPTLVLRVLVSLLL